MTFFFPAVVGHDVLDWADAVGEAIFQRLRPFST